MSKEFSKVSNKINSFLKKRIPLPQENFIATAKKTGGAASGYISENEYGKFLIKNAYNIPLSTVQLDTITAEELKNKMLTYDLTNHSEHQIDTIMQNEQKTIKTNIKKALRPQYDKRDLINEYIYGGLYTRLLYNNTSVISLLHSKNDIASNSENDKIISIRIEFLENFATLSQKVGAKSNKIKRNNTISLDNQKFLQNIIGLEKVTAVCMLMSDEDFHGGNLGVTTHSTSQEYKVIKIDHGKAGTAESYTNESTIRHNFFKYLSKYEYYDNVKFNAKELSDTIDQLSTLGSDEVKNIVNSRIQDLKNANVQVNSLALWQIDDIDTYDNKLDQLATEIANKYEHNLSALKDMKKVLDVITLIRPTDEQLQNGRWLEKYKNQTVSQILISLKTNGQTLGDSNEDPIIFATRNNILLDDDIELHNSNLIKTKKKLTDMINISKDKDTKLIL